MSKLNNSNNEGFVVLITVLILGVVLTTIAIFLLLTGSNASISAQSVDGGVEAKSAATGCAELALLAIQANPSLATPSSGSSTLSSSENCTYNISGSTPKYTILAVGNFTQGTNTYIHNLDIITSQVSPSIIISSWQDTP